MKGKIEEYREYLISEAAGYQRRENEYDLLNNEKLSQMCMLRGRTINKAIDKFNELFPKEVNQPQSPGTGTGDTSHGDRRGGVGEE
jgi:hypothetical protein